MLSSSGKFDFSGFLKTFRKTPLTNFDAPRPQNFFAISTDSLTAAKFGTLSIKKI